MFFYNKKRYPNHIADNVRYFLQKNQGLICQHCQNKPTDLKVINADMFSIRFVSVIEIRGILRL